jgi:hypothetical protein
MSAKLRLLAERWHVNLWSLIVAPTIWALHFLFCYVVAAIHCAKAGRLASLQDVRVVIAVATLVALMAVGVSVYVAWAHSTIEGDPPPHQQSTDEDRQRFLGVAKLLLACLSLVAIVFTAIPAFVFEDCR